MKATGKCFENSVRYILDVRPKDDLTLVHCIVTGTGSKVKGVEYSHAFVVERINTVSPEDSFVIGDPYIEVAIDVTKEDGLENPTIIPLGLYRILGNLRNEIRYTRDETRRMILEYAHYGAWDERLQTDADRAVRKG